MDNFLKLACFAPLAPTSEPIQDYPLNPPSSKRNTPEIIPIVKPSNLELVIYKGIDYVFRRGEIRNGKYTIRLLVNDHLNHEFDGNDINIIIDWIKIFVSPMSGSDAIVWRSMGNPELHSLYTDDKMRTTLEMLASRSIA